MTFLDLLKNSLRLINAIDVGEEPTAAEGADGLQTANTMLDAWSTERLAVFTIIRQTFALPASTQTRTVGTGGNVSIARPPKIERAGIVDSAGNEYPIDYFTEVARWAAITDKDATSDLPDRVWDNCGFPYRTLSFYPIATGTPTAAIYTWTALGSIAALSTTVAFPPGYLEAIIYNLAVRLAPEYGKATPLEVAAIAMQSKGVIKSSNQPELTMKCDPAYLTGGRLPNIYTGEI